jgi:hypothetical protein
VNIVHGLLHALGIAGSMTWQVTWSLILGFTLLAIIEALVRKSSIARLLPNDRPKSLATATVLGALLTGAAVCAMGQRTCACSGTMLGPLADDRSNCSEMMGKMMTLSSPAVTSAAALAGLMACN